MSLHTKMVDVASQEHEYGTEMGMVRRAPISTTAHPLEESERTFHQRQEDARLSSAARSFGLGFAQHFRHQRAAAGCSGIGHLPVLPKSRAHLEALTGRDLELDFSDTLALEPEVTHNPHLIMEKLQQRPLFRI